jgi:hypothetical protein
VQRARLSTQLMVGRLVHTLRCAARDWLSRGRGRQRWRRASKPGWTVSSTRTRGLGRMDRGASPPAGGRVAAGDALDGTGSLACDAVVRLRLSDGPWSVAAPAIRDRHLGLESLGRSRECEGTSRNPATASSAKIDCRSQSEAERGSPWARLHVSASTWRSG